MRKKKRDRNIFLSLQYTVLLLYFYIYIMHIYIYLSIYSLKTSFLLYVYLLRCIIHFLFFSILKVLKTTLHHTCIGLYLSYAAVYGVS